jgi:hypothetical protein
MQAFVAPNMTVEETETLLTPWFNTLDSLKVTYAPWYNHADNLLVWNLYWGHVFLLTVSSHDAWVVVFPEEDEGTDVVRTVSRLMPRSVFEDDNLRNQTLLAHKNAIDSVRIISSSLTLLKFPLLTK